MDSDDPKALRQALADAGSASERLALHIQLAALYFDLPVGLKRLERLPKTSRFREKVVRALYRTATRLHNTAATAQLGQELLELVKRPTPSLAYVVGCATASLGDLEGARRAFAIAEAEVEAIRSNPNTFAKRWPSAVKYAFDMHDIPRARADIERARRFALPSVDSLFGEDDANRFIEEFPEELDLARRNTLALLNGEPADFPNELVRVVAPRPDLFCFARPHQLASKQSWQRLVGEVYRRARAEGGRACFVPDWLEGHASRQQKPPMLVSYHTTGAADGVVHFKEADLPQYMIVDRRGYSGWSTLADRTIKDLKLDRLNEETANTFHRRFVNQVVARNRSKYVQPAAGEEALPSRFVFVALQVPTDRVHALAFMDMKEMLGVVARRFAGTDTVVLAKRHPLDTDPRTTELLDTIVGEGLIRMTSAGIHSLIAGSEAVVTANSGVGSEALAHLKPVYLFGKADYAAAAHTVRTEADFRELTSPIRLPISEQELRRFLLYYRRRYLVDTENPESLAEAVQGRIIAPALERRRLGLTTQLPPLAKGVRKGASTSDRQPAEPMQSRA